MRVIKKTLLYEVLEINQIEPEVQKEWDKGWRMIERNLITPENPDTPMTTEITYLLKELTPQ